MRLELAQRRAHPFHSAEVEREFVYEMAARSRASDRANAMRRPDEAARARQWFPVRSAPVPPRAGSWAWPVPRATAARRTTAAAPSLFQNAPYLRSWPAKSACRLAEWTDRAPDRRAHARC